MELKKVPFSDTFYADTEGNIFDSKGVKRNTSINGDGYITVNIKTDRGLWITFGVHRVIALTYIENDNFERNQVNHRDLDITNNKVDNLEWVTPLENNIHSELMRLDREHICVYSIVNGIIHKGYKNAYDAAKDNNCCALDVWDSIKNDLSVNGIKFCFRRHADPKPEELKYDRRKNFTLNNRQGPKPIKTLDIFSGEEMWFKSILEAAKYFETTTSHVFQAISKTSYPRVFRKRYQVTYSDLDFPFMTEEEKERAKIQGSKKVLAYNINSNKYILFPSAAEYIRHTKLSKKAITVNLKKDRIKVIDGWIALYASDQNAKKIKSYISSPVVV